MNQLKTGKRKAVIAALVEGNSINSTVRMTGVAKTTILRLLADLGRACGVYHHKHVRGVKPARIQCDEVWSFVHCKDKNVETAKAQAPGIGDCWTWTALDPDSKLMITWHVGLRSPEDARHFMLDLSERVNTPVAQLTTDGYTAYPDAVREAFGTMVNYAQLVKVYVAERPGEARYSPAKCNGSKKNSVIGFPDVDHICTSHVERSNLTVRMSMRRFTRLTNAFSKKVENHAYAFALFTMHYNYCRKHSSLNGRTPAMVAGLADHVWTLDELIGLLG